MNLSNKIFRYSISLLLLFTFLFILSAIAEDPERRAKEELRSLKVGNEHFIKGTNGKYNFVKLREMFAKSQQPHTIILTCADSRVVPEYIFDQGLGQIFVVRNAGNIMDSATIGSIEYAIEHLKAKRLLVLGHTHCGAVTAAFEGETESPFINSIIHSIYPAVIKVRNKFPDKEKGIQAAIELNVKNQMLKAIELSKIIREAVEQYKLQVIGGVYDIETGKIEFLKGSGFAVSHDE
jgi:carbonic anhydrase